MPVFFTSVANFLASILVCWSYYQSKITTYFYYFSKSILDPTYLAHEQVYYTDLYLFYSLVKSLLLRPKVTKIEGDSIHWITYVGLFHFIFEKLPVGAGGHNIGREK